MDSETERIYDRMRLHKLHLAHRNWTAVQLADEIGRSERWVRKWLKVLGGHENLKLSAYLSRSRAPKTRHRQTSKPVEDRICELRESLSESYHRPASATLIRHYLLQEETLKNEGYFIPRSSRTINKVLRERGYIQTPQKRDHMPLILSPPMEEWEMDFCEIRLEDGQFEFFLVVDRGTSRVVYLEGCEGYRADSALEAVCRLFSTCGLPKRLRFDRDPRFVWSWSTDSFPAPLIRFLRVLGVEPVICPPRRPDLKPHVERCVRTLKREWLDRFSLNTMADCYEALEAFAQYHNSQRLHFGRACRGRTPDEAFPNLPALPQLPDSVQPNRWIMDYHGRVFRRRIRANGMIQIDKHLYYVDQKRSKQLLLVHLDGDRRCFWLTIDGKPLPKPLPLQGLLPQEMDLQDYLKVLQDEAMSIAYYRHMVWMQSNHLA